MQGSIKLHLFHNGLTHLFLHSNHKVSAERVDKEPLNHDGHEQEIQAAIDKLKASPSVNDNEVHLLEEYLLLYKKQKTEKTEKAEESAQPNQAVQTSQVSQVSLPKPTVVKPITSSTTSITPNPINAPKTPEQVKTEVQEKKEEAIKAEQTNKPESKLESIESDVTKQ